MSGYNIPPDVQVLIEEAATKLAFANGFIRSGSLNERIARIVAEIRALLEPEERT
jgi:hypothetical protein